jgi:hypothetical protein
MGSGISCWVCAEAVFGEPKPTTLVNRQAQSNSDSDSDSDLVSLEIACQSTGSQY